MTLRHRLLAASLVVGGIAACDTPPPDAVSSAGVAACAADTVHRHDDPVALAEEWVRRDAEGPMEREDLAAAWEAGALHCAAPRATTPGAYVVVDAFRVRAGAREADTARVLVDRSGVYRVESDSGAPPRLVAAPERWTDTIRVVRTPAGWRLAQRPPGTHRLPGRALGELARLAPADRARLERLVVPGGP